LHGGIIADDAYKSTDSEFLESDSSQNQCGSTASTAVLVGDRLFVANVGDSRAIICRGGNGNEDFTVPALQITLLLFLNIVTRDNLLSSKTSFVKIVEQKNKVQSSVVFHQFTSSTI
jgi:hypothetical protein